MKISYNWLKDYLSLNETADEVSKALTSIGLEVESMEHIESVKGGLHGVVVGHVISCGKHPEADRLSLTSVEVGAGAPLQIVCGAPNVAAGQKVAVATVGTTLFFASGEEVKIKKSKIRGVESFGMICAEDELGIGTSHDGIMVLDPAVPVGTPLRDLLQLKDDVVFEIGLTPNRIDAASHLGVARDLAAFFRRKINLPDITAFAVDNTSNPYAVEVQKAEACIRYTGITLSGLKVTSSPEWLQNRLRAIGINPRNNVVDATNYILHELGQPLHAFDADQIAGKNVVVRTCAQGTEFVTLDGQTRQLDANDLMICSTTEPMCIAGVLGGLHSGVTENTCNVFLESACFHPVWVRKTARRHGIFTDSSFRFERGVDPNMTLYALKRAALLIKQLAGGTISSDCVDIYPTVVKPCEVEMSYTRINRLIGKEIPKNEIHAILSALEMQVLQDKDDVLVVSIPTYRVDVLRECDVVEDLLRIYGYNNIEIPQQVRSTLSYAPQPDKDRLVNMVSDYLSANGFLEIMSNSLTKASHYAELTTFKPENSARILNPLSNDLNVMRQTLLFGGLEAIARNIKHRNSDLRLYETGNCYSYLPGQPEGLQRYGEETRLALFITGDWLSDSWNRKAEASNFFTLKESVEKLLGRLGIDLYQQKMGDVPADIFTDGFKLSSRKETILSMGIVAKPLRKQFDIDQDVYFAEIRWEALLNFAKQQKILYAEMARFPEVRRDLALVLDQDVKFATLRDLAFRTERTLLKSVNLFDVYEGNKLPENKKQYALSFVLQDKDKTLNDVGIDRVMGNLLKCFEKETGATLR